MEAYYSTQNVFMEAYEFTTTGTYTLVVNTSEGATGTTTLTAYNASAVTGTITPTTEGQSKTVTIGVPGQRARITFSGTSGQTVTLKARETTFGSGSWFTVANPEGTRITGYEELSGEGASVELALSATGTYTILLTPAGADTGSVKLTAYLGSHPGMVRRQVSPGSASTGGASTLAGPKPSGADSALTSMSPIPPDAPSIEAGGSFRSPSVNGATATSGHRAPARETPFVHQAAVGFSVSPEVRAFRPTGPTAWRPPTNSRSGQAWETGEPPSPWAKIAPLQTFYGATALAGQVLAQNGLPLTDVHVSIEGTPSRLRPVKQGGSC